MRKSGKSHKPHGLADNIFFYVKIWAKIFPVGILLIPIFAALGIISVYEKVNIPRVLLEVLEKNGDFSILFSSLLIPVLILIFSKTVMPFLSSALMALASRPMIYLYSVPINEKLFTMHYQTLISPSTQSKLVKAKNIATGGDGNSIHFFGMILGNLLTAVAGVIVFSSKIIFVDPVLLVIIIISAAINLIYGFYVGRYVNKNMKERGEDEKKENYIMRVLEDRSYAKDIRLYNLKRWLFSKFTYYHNRHSGYLLKEARVRISAVIVNSLLVFVRDLLAYGYLISMLTSGEISVSVFVFLLGLVFQFSSWMDLIVEQINSLITFSTMINQIREFLDVDDDVTSLDYGDCKATDVAKCPTIEFRNLSFRYPEGTEWIFKNFSLKIGGGEKIALVGINGAGKTTLMLILMGLLHPSEGDVLIDGKSYRDFEPSEYYRLFSPLFQDITIFPETIKDNVTLGNDVKPDKISKTFQMSGLDEIIKKLPEGEATFLVKNSQDKAMDLSGGQNQRLLLARALLKDAKINILDEPTAALDPVAESQIYEEYGRIVDNSTSIFISHRLASTRFCDRIVLIEYGKVIEHGTHEELMELGGRYKEMYDVQSQYYKNEAGGYAE